MILVLALLFAPQVQWWGQIVAAEHATVGQSEATAGTTLYPGDRLATDANGVLQGRSRTGYGASVLGATFKLEPGTTIELEEGPAAKLLAGRLTFETISNRMSFTVYVEQAVIRAESDEPTIGQVVYVSQKECLVIARKNALFVTVGDETKVVNEGLAYRVLLQPEETQVAGATPHKAGRSRFLLTAAGFITAATIVAISEAMESPSRF